MKTIKAYWKIEPEIEVEGKTEEEIEELIHDKLMDITMNPHDWISFDEVGQDVEFEKVKE